MITKSKVVIPCARQRETLLRRHGIHAAAMDPGSAAQHYMLRSIRDDARGWAGMFLAALALAACGASEAPTRTFDRDPQQAANLPFSAAVVAGDTIFLSGQIGRKPGETALVEGGVAAETKQIFENYTTTLARLDSSLADIVKCTVFLDDMADYAAMNAAYAEAFPGDKPARSTLGADGLAFNAAVEIECIAVRGQE